MENSPVPLCLGCISVRSVFRITYSILCMINVCMVGSYLPAFALELHGPNWFESIIKGLVLDSLSLDNVNIQTP